MNDMDASKNQTTPHPLHEFWQTYPKPVQWQLQWLLAMDVGSPLQSMRQRPIRSTIGIGLLLSPVILLVIYQPKGWAGNTMLLLGAYYGIYAWLKQYWSQLPNAFEALKNPPPPIRGKVHVSPKSNPMAKNLDHLNQRVLQSIAPTFLVLVSDGSGRVWQYNMTQEHWLIKKGTWDADLFCLPRIPHPVLAVANNTLFHPQSTPEQVPPEVWNKLTNDAKKAD